MKNMPPKRLSDRLMPSSRAGARQLTRLIIAGQVAPL